ncbi:MAG: exodeoxyribonuclease VII large subunit [Clostridiales bacterium]|nr:exodeoxyribonuclease VII large subunit [Clostridiales bacterium]
MNVVSVSQLNRYIKALLDENSVLQNVYVSGEISNFKNYYRSGHLYFTLKDEGGALKCIMFSSYASRLKFSPQDGMNVICRGRVSAYEKNGEYQLYAEDMQPSGEGAYLIAFNQLKDKLEKEGLFDSAVKKELPPFPRKIGVATSESGAAVEDIKNITKRRYPLAQLVIAPTAVQGDFAPQEIARALAALDNEDQVDVIIVGRGGGSVEDLWAFNTETVARAVYACKTPVISAVGHETDYTICDFVADLRAPTPSAAAELACPDSAQLLQDISAAKNKMINIMQSRVDSGMQRVAELAESRVLSDLGAYIDVKNEKLNSLFGDICFLYRKKLDFTALGFEALVEKLDALSPLAVLKRGFAIAEKGGKVLKSVRAIKKDDEILLLFSDGRAICNVKEVEKNGN